MGLPSATSQFGVADPVRHDPMPRWARTCWLTVLYVRTYSSTSSRRPAAACSTLESATEVSSRARFSARRAGHGEIDSQLERCQELEQKAVHLRRAFLLGPVATAFQHDA